MIAKTSILSDHKIFAFTLSYNIFPKVITVSMSELVTVFKNQRFLDNCCPAKSTKKINKQKKQSSLISFFSILKDYTKDPTWQ